MNNTTEFELKLQSVVDLMIRHQLRRDVDDTLLEKLLGVLKSHCSPNVLSQENAETHDGIAILKKTNFCLLFQSSLEYLDHRKNDESDHVAVFAIRSIGIFSSQPKVFYFLMEQGVLGKLQDVFFANSKVHYLPTFHAAMLSALTDVAEHKEGLKWLLQNDLPNMAFSSFDAASFYVRKASIQFLTKFLVQWPSLCGNEHKENIVNILRKLCNFRDSTSYECCISVMRASMEQSHVMRAILLEDLDLISTIPLSSEMTNSTIQLLAEIHVYRNSSISDIKEQASSTFLQQGCQVSAVEFTTTFLWRKQETVTVSDLDVIMQPLLDFHDENSTNNNCQNVDENVKPFIPSASFRGSLVPLAKLFPLMDLNTLLYVSTHLCHFSLVCCKLGYFKLLSQKKLMLVLVETFDSLMKTQSFPNVGNSSREKCFETFLKLADSISSDNIAMPNILKLIRMVVQSNGTNACTYSPEFKTKFATNLKSKLLGPSWCVIDSALEIVLDIVEKCKGGQHLWQNFVLEHDLHTFIWDLAFLSNAEDYVRASAIKVLTSMCSCQFLFEKLKVDKDTSDTLIVTALCKLVQDSDSFIYQQCVSSLCQWLLFKALSTEDRSNQNAFETLVRVMAFSLDSDSKLNILHFWQAMSEKLLSSDEGVKEILELLGNLGYTTCALIGIKDDSLTVQYAALRMMEQLRQTLTNLDINEKTYEFETTEVGKFRKTELPSEPVVTFSKDHRDKVMDEMLNDGTLHQIYSLMETEDNSCDIFPFINKPLVSDGELGSPSLCSLYDFWRLLWSQDHKELLVQQSNSTKQDYVKNISDLLDDIIASRIEPEVIHQDIDCY